MGTYFKHVTLWPNFEKVRLTNMVNCHHMTILSICAVYNKLVFQISIPTSANIQLRPLPYVLGNYSKNLSTRWQDSSKIILLFLRNCTVFINFYIQLDPCAKPSSPYSVNSKSIACYSFWIFVCVRKHNEPIKLLCVNNIPLQYTGIICLLPSILHVSCTA